MKKLTMTVALFSVLASPGFAASVNYGGTATSGTAANQQASIAISSAATTKAFYVDQASGAKSVKTAAAVQLVKASDWSFDFSNPSQVAFTGNIVYGDYRVQNNISGFVTMDGRQSYYGVTQSFSGVGTYNSSTNTFTYTFQNSTSDGSGGSVESHSATATCADGATSVFGTVCGNFNTSAGALNWEGLALNFVFSADRSSFAGSLVGTNKQGEALTASTTTINWQVAGTAAPVSEVPVPAAAWLFGSGLLGLVGASRRRAS